MSDFGMNDEAVILGPGHGRNETNGGAKRS
jgi:hypothetical protein